MQTGLLSTLEASVRLRLRRPVPANHTYLTCSAIVALQRQQKHHLMSEINIRLSQSCNSRLCWTETVYRIACCNGSGLFPVQLFSMGIAYAASEIVSKFLRANWKCEINENVVNICFYLHSLLFAITRSCQPMQILCGKLSIFFSWFFCNFRILELIRNKDMFL